MSNKLKLLFFYSLLGSGVFIFSLMFVKADPLNLWQDSGSNLYYTAGNVGIGTTAPRQKLEISGNLLFGNNYSLYWRDLANTSYDAFIKYDTTNNMVFGTGGNTRVTILNGGNVGIGTTSPSMKLSVNGSVYSNTSFCLKGVCISNWNTLGSSTTTVPMINNDDIGYITYVSTPTGGYYYIPFLYYLFVTILTFLCLYVTLYTIKHEKAKR